MSLDREDDLTTPVRAGTTTLDATTPTDTHAATARARFARFLPAVAVAAVSVVALTANGVGIVDISLFALYWIVCLVVPGVLIARALVGVGTTLTEDIAIGAVIGLAMEAVSFVLLDGLGLHGAIRWWWVVVYVAFIAHPTLRRVWQLRAPSTTAPEWAWGISAATTMGIVLAAHSFRTHELSPAPGVPYVDHFFHLSLINEMMRQGPHQVPQVAGESLAYHMFSHAHMANASTITGIAPDVVLSRLWLVPMVVLTVVLIGVLANRVTYRPWTGVVAVGLSLFALSGNSIWTDRAVTVASPVVFDSPSQILANPIFIGACVSFVGVLRSANPWRWSALFLLLAAGGVGAKPTVVPILFAGAAVALVAMWILQRRVPTRVAACTAGLLVIQFGWLVLSPPIEGKITVLGSVGSLAVFREITGTGGLRAVSDTLLLDRLDSARAWFAAGVAILWLAAAHSARMIGLGTLALRATRRDPIAWWLAGTYTAGWGAFFIIDQSGFSQAYFAITAIPAGAVLSAWFLATLLDRVEPAQRAAAVSAGIVLAVSTSLAVRGIVTARSTSTTYGPVESSLLPVILASLIGIAGVLSWRFWQHWNPARATAAVVGATFVLALSLAPALGEFARLGGSLFVERPAVDESSAGFVSRNEQEAMAWLRDNTPLDAVVATNVHCRPPGGSSTTCDARSFVVSGLGGRRVVLEGWGYTPEAQVLHGTNGLSFANQPSPWPERLRLSDAAVTAPTPQVLDELAEEYQASWIVGFRRAGSVSADLANHADEVFDNGEVAIYRIRTGQ